MIIFDLDCLANDEHRRHFIEKPEDVCHECYKLLIQQPIIDIQCLCGRWPTRWKPDYKAYNEACERDKPIESCADVIRQMSLRFPENSKPIEIWSIRCESMMEKTTEWIHTEIGYFKFTLKMRPIGDTRPKEELFESWVNEQCADHIEAQINGKPFGVKHNIDCVFSSHKKTMEMFRKRGVFVFDCNQEKE